MPGDENGSVFSRLGQRGLVGRMHEQLDELLASRDQMEQLLALNIEIGVDLDLDATLGRIVTAARQLTGARYGALGVRGADGRLMSFVHAGMDADTVARLGDLPVGKGLLGVLLNQPDIVRLSDLTAHPAAVGFPEHHPPMRAFLGVPIIIREAAFGSLYLGDDRPGQVFNESHENAVRALASVAAVAIDNAHLFDQVSTTAQWTAASREITTAVLSGGDSGQAALSLIAERVCELTAAEQAIDIAINQPLPGSSSTDTVIDVGAERFININTNGVSGTVQVIASLRIAVPRAGIEQLTGLPVAQAAHDANTNAVAQIAFAKLLSTLPVIAAELASEPSNALSSP
mgnify:CR=1 FL=1